MLLKRIKLLLSLGESDQSQDDTLCTLIEIAKDAAVSFCNLSEYNDGLNSVIIKMVLEDYNKLGSEGLNSYSFSGVMSENYLNGYSADIQKMLKKHRKLNYVK